MPSLLSVNNYYYYRGGAETVFFSHNQLFEDIGWQVIPFAMKHSKNIETEWSKYFVEDIEFGTRYSFWEKTRRAHKIIYSMEAKSNIDVLARNYQFDICHAHNIYHHISPSILGAIKKHRIPIVMTLHDLKIACPAYNMLSSDGICERCKNGKSYHVLLNRCIKGSIALSALVMIESYLHKMLRTFDRYVDKFIVPSQFYIEKLVEWGWDRDRFVHISNFVDFDLYRPEYHPGNSFLYFGRLSREKGLKTLIAAAKQAEVPLKIVGVGMDEGLLREYSSAIYADVEFLGYQSGLRLHEIIRSARAIILPSEWYENAPMSVIEAYALGKPVVGAEIGGIPELIRSGETGYTFMSGSINSLADTLRMLMDLPDEQLSVMGKVGRSWAASEFSKEKYREEILNVYRSLGSF